MDEEVPDLVMLSGASEEMLTLQQLQAALIEAGVDIAYSTLSELLKIGNAMDLLKAGGSRGKRQFPKSAAAILIEFIPQFRTANHKSARFSEELERWMTDHNQVDPGIVHVPSPFTSDELAMMLARIEGFEKGLASVDEVLTAKEAAEFLKVSPRTLRKSVPPARRLGTSATGDRWTRSQILRFMNDGANHQS